VRACVCAIGEREKLCECEERFVVYKCAPANATLLWSMIWGPWSVCMCAMEREIERESEGEGQKRCHVGSVCSGWWVA